MDCYNLKNDWENFKKLIDDLEQDVEVYLKRPGSRKWCTLVRKNSKDIDDLGKKIRKNTLKQRQDYKSDYS